MSLCEWGVRHFPVSRVQTYFSVQCIAMCVIEEVCTHCDVHLDCLRCHSVFSRVCVFCAVQCIANTNQISLLQPAVISPPHHCHICNLLRSSVSCHQQMVLTTDSRSTSSLVTKACKYDFRSISNHNYETELTNPETS